MKRNRIPWYLFQISLLIAISIDIVQLMLQPILILGWILSRLIGLGAWIGYTMFYLWRGVGFFDRNILAKLLISVATLMLEVSVDVLPAYTIMTVAIYLIVKAEDVAINRKILSAETLEQLQKVAQKIVKRQFGAEEMMEEIQTYRRRRHMDDLQGELPEAA